ncbi:hypothetical protein GCM10017161_39460 [Thalassotalea marina]|uniref:Uncharacterized protein n=1 Tax=Thalassotalea marina TaxID=1673741 RepID=A0A919BRS9_9GAMM|nr:hypothetical protein GCM10017161_39460 [Thalassotalea marina]
MNDSNINDTTRIENCVNRFVCCVINCGNKAVVKAIAFGLLKAIANPCRYALVLLALIGAIVSA